MKSTFIFVVLILTAQNLCGQNYIDFQQLRIDRLDGVEDFSYANDPNSSVFFSTIDSIEQLILNADIAAESKKQISLEVYSLLINYQGAKPLSKYECNSLIYLREFLLSVQHSSPDYFLSSSPTKSYEILQFIYTLPSAQYFLQQEVKQYPKKVIQHFQDFSKALYAAEILHEAAIRDPMAVKPYLGTYNVIDKQLKSSTNPIDSLIIHIFKSTGKASNALSLLSTIESGDLSPEGSPKVRKKHRGEARDSACPSLLSQAKMPLSFHFLPRNTVLQHAHLMQKFLANACEQMMHHRRPVPGRFARCRPAG